MKKITFAISVVIAFSLYSSFSSFTIIHPGLVANKDSLQKPATLTPYNMDINKPVTARALRDNVKQWHTAWKNKEVTVIVWTGGGISSRVNSPNTIFISDHNNQGNVVLEADFLPGQKDSLYTRNPASPFVSIRGKIKSTGRSVVLEQCRVVGAVDITSKSGNLNPFLLNETTPVFPTDILKSVDAWKGVEVVIKDKCNMPVFGNTISFVDDLVKPSRGLPPDLVLAVLKSPVKSKATGSAAGRMVPAIKKLKGKVNSFYEKTGEVTLYDCEIIP